MFTAYKRSFWQGNIFTVVFGCPQRGWLPSMHHKFTTMGVCLWWTCLQRYVSRRLWLWGVCFQGVCIKGGWTDLPWACLEGLCILGVGQTHPQDTWDTTGYGQQAVGTHPTGMAFLCSYYCHVIIIVFHQVNRCGNNHWLFHSEIKIMFFKS